MGIGIKQSTNKKIFFTPQISPIQKNLFKEGGTTIALNVLVLIPSMIH